MRIYLLRHGKTSYNAEKRYQGTRDIPLCDEGRAELGRADFTPDRVYVSPLCRARESASILFPGVRQVVVPDFREMCFGSFEGRNYVDMEKDPDYLAWVNGNCEGSCPDGERRADFSRRSCEAFRALVEQSLAEGRETLAIMAHGGTQMAVMEAYALPHEDYYHWCSPNAGGYLLETDAARWNGAHTVQLLRTVQYLSKGEAT
jgi:alpha-ribazole phosphatase